MATRPVLITVEHSGRPILIIDREGGIGLGLIAHLKGQVQAVFVGGREPKQKENTLFIPFVKTVPQIPADPYSHIFYVVASEKELDDITPSLIEKAANDNAKFFVIGEQKILEKEKVQNLFSASKQLQIIFLGDIFENTLARKQQSFIDNIFYQAKIKKKIMLSDMGLKKLFPVLYEDVIVEILRVAFGPRSSSKILFLHMQYPITQLGLAHAIQKTDPLVKIDFDKNNPYVEKQEVGIEDGEYLLPESYPVLENIQKAYANYAGVPLEEEEFFDFERKSVAPEFSLEEKPKQRKISKVFSAVFSLIIFIVSLALLPVVIVSGAGFIGQESLKNVISDIENSNVAKAKRDVVLAKQAIFVARATVPALFWEAKLIGKGPLVVSFNSALDYAQEALGDIGDIVAVSNGLQKITSSTDALSKEDFFAGLGALKHLIVVAQKSSGNQFLSATIKTNFLQSLANSSAFINVVDSLPDVLGVEKKQTYLVLFQNNAELRPGGGFIGSYGLLTFDGGKVADFSIHDVYDADGQLKGHIEPPFAIRRYIPQVHMYLRDSNFDIDFTKDAFLAAFIYQQETGQQVDGVIGVDLSFVRDIIGAVGSVYVPAYNQIVTKDNFFLLAENHAEKNFFPGSSQKKDFLQGVFSSLQEKITSGQGISYLRMLQAVITGISDKDILLAFSDGKRQDLFTANGLSSSLWDGRKTEDNVINDFVGINEANLGVDKVNYFIKRSVKQQVVISDSGTITGQINVTLTNASTGAWPGGTYKDYVRFILPSGAIVTKILIDGEEKKMIPAITNPLIYESKSFVAPKDFEIEQTEETGKTLYGFMTYVSPQSTQTIFVYYKLPNVVPVQQPDFSYNLWVFKQPGTDTYPYSLSLSYPRTYKVLSTASGIIQQDNNLLYNTNLSGDTYLQAAFTKR